MNPFSTRPDKVAFIAMGGSRMQFENSLMSDYRNGKDYDEVWVANSLGMMMDESHYDKLWMMDDMKGNHRKYMKDSQDKPWFDPNALANKKKPIITSTKYEEFGDNVYEFPLKEVFKKAPLACMPSTTTCYALVYAIYSGVKHYHMFGTDFELHGVDPEFAKNMEQADIEIAVRGRMAVAHWLGVAVGTGMNVYLPDNSDLLGGVRFYTKEGGIPYGYPETFNLKKLMTEEPTNGNE